MKKSKTYGIILCILVFLLVSGCGGDLLSTIGTGTSSTSGETGGTTGTTGGSSGGSGTGDTGGSGSSGGGSTTPSWKDVGSPGFSTGEVEYVSFAGDPNGNLYVAYTDKTSTRALVQIFDGTSWRNMGSGYVSDEGTEMVSLTIDTHTTPIPLIAYKVNNYSNRYIRVKKFENSTWQQVGADITDVPASQGSPLQLSMWLSTPYIAYPSTNSSQAGIVKKFSPTGGWEDLGTNFSDSSPANYMSFLLYGSTPYVAYERNQGGYIKKWSGSSWDLLNPPDTTFNTYHLRLDAIALTVGIYGPVVIYREQYDNALRICVKRLYVGESTYWIDLGNIGICSDDVPKGIVSIAITSDDTLYAAFRDSENGNKVTVKKRTYSGAQWETVGGGPASASAAEYINLIVLNNVPYIAYKDYANGGKITVRKYE